MEKNHYRNHHFPHIPIIGKVACILLCGLLAAWMYEFRPTVVLMAERNEGETVSYATVEKDLSTLYERAEKMSETYGIEIMIGEKVELTPAGYEIGILKDYALLKKGLDSIEYVLKRYPEGFFEQLVFGNMKGLKIALTGDLLAEEDTDYPEKAGGYVAQVNGYTEMALSITSSNSIASTCYHEFAHLIEHRIRYISENDPESPFSDESWNDLNPEGFAYADNYHTNMELENSPWKGYFLNSYSLTFAAEDRAELMRDAMLEEAVWTGANDVRTNPYLLEKFKYFCQCIRYSFDTENWPEETQWETALYHSLLAPAA